MARDVFVSYSNRDKLTADAICATLESHKIRCWIAPRDILPGKDWTDAIIDAITECRIFLLILSGASNDSEQVKREVQNAVSEAKPILPFRIEDVDLSKHMRYFIGTPHWMDALTPPMEAHLHRMAQTVTALINSMDEKGIERPPAILSAIPIPPTPAWEPPSSRKDDSAPTVNRPSIPDATLNACASTLAEYIGPLAKMLVKRSAKECVDLADFRRRLVTELSTDAEKAKFIRQLDDIT